MAETGRSAGDRAFPLEIAAVAALIGDSAAGIAAPVHGGRAGPRITSPRPG
ncbi:hypothetical protein [Actinokineospora cianjurensis]|uniref:hypothetical protein n=1 Tax=Actinokineospora cianjurensis TaxID=585224 RepID=UPI001476FEC6|nr:hypothetical protein [Actinokineospora cianjurensis]